MKKKSLLIVVLLVFGFSLSLSAQTINATQTDEIIIDNGVSGKADPNDRIRYKVTIQNTAGPAGTGTQLNVVPDPKTTFVAGTFRSSPLALNDAYPCTGNVGLNVPAASGLKANDFDDNIGGLTVTAGTFATTGGGSIMIATDGSFMYSPPPGLTGGGTDTYTYTLNDGNGVGGGVPATDMAVVTFTLNNLIWFVNNTGGGSGGNGTLSTPFKTLADFNAGSATAGDVIYVEETGTNYTGGIVLQNNEDLYGEGHSGGANLSNVLPFGLATHSKTLPTINGNNPVILNTGGTAIALASGNTLRGVDVGSSGTPQNGTGISGTGVGALTIDELSVFVGGGSAGKGINLDGGGPIDIEIVQLNLVSCNPIAIDVNNISGGTWDVPLTDISNATVTGMEISNSSVNFTLSTLNITGGGAHGVYLNACGGNFTVNGGAITNPSSGACVLITTGTVVFLGSGAISKNTPGFAIDISDHDAGNITFQTGAISSTGTSSGLRVQNCNGGTITFSSSSKILTTGGNPAVTLSNNTGATINFTNGGLVINSTSGAGFNATGGGTVTVQGAGNTIFSTTGTALNVTSTTIGASGLTFQSIAANGGTNGIVLNSTGSGGLTVTGTGTTDGSGGTIQNTSNRGASFISASNITLKNMNFTNAGTSDLDADNSGLSTGDNLATNASIHLQSVTTATLENMNISGGAEQGINGNAVSNFTLSNSSIVDAGNGPDEDGIHFYNMSGTSAITNTTINCTVPTPNTTGGDDHLNLQMQSGTLNLTISGGSATNANKGSGYLFGIRGTADATITFSSASSTNNFSGGIVADAFDSAIMDLTVSNSTSSGNNDQLSVSAGDNSNVDLNASGNTLSSPNAADFVVVSLLGSAFDEGYTFDAILNDNDITVGNGRTADGITVFNAGGGLMRIAITNNTIDYAGTQRGILIQGGQDGSSTVEATITGNTMDIELDGTGNAVNGILAQSQVTDPEGNGSTLCVDIGGAGALANTFTHSLGGTLAGGDIRVRQRFTGNVKLPGYAGGGTDTAAVITYLNGRNTVVSASTATFQDGVFNGGGACLQPN